MIREGIFAPGEFYHLIAHGVHDITLFKNEYDFGRFLFGVLAFQAPVTIKNVGRKLQSITSIRSLKLEPEVLKEIIKKGHVAVVGFALMPKHLHLVVEERTEGGISKYMQRLLTSHSKYFGARYGHKGHVFRGAFKAVHVEDNNQLLYLSAYVHRNPHELKKWKDKAMEYPWSSYMDYVSGNTWSDLLAPDIILKQVDTSTSKEYIDFVETSGAKAESIYGESEFE